MFYLFPILYYIKELIYIQKIFNIQSSFLILIILFVCIFFIPFLNKDSLSNSDSLDSEIISTNPDGFVWPIPGYTKISSPFGKRISPTSGASSSHSGIDIPAPQGSKFIAVHDGEITFRQFLGAGGYTITLQNDIYTISYCHVSPLFTVSVGDFVSQGEHIGSVGPKNVYGVINNPYRDSNGNPTNGATTGPHLHFTLKINNQAVNPLDYLSF